MCSSYSFGSFWHGEKLSAVECSCIHSLVSQGISVTLFSYNEIRNVPVGVMTRNANDIVPQSMLFRFILNGKPNLAHFSDFFRYKMMRETGLVWVDLDMMFIGDFPSGDMNDIVVLEKDGSINNAILYISSIDVIDYLIFESSMLVDKNLRWGETGPILLNKAKKIFSDRMNLLDYSVFYPIAYDEIYKIFLPKYLLWCQEKMSSAVSVHLFNNILTKMGYWKDIGPPKGSFFEDVLFKTNGMSFFCGQYPLIVMENMIENYCLRLSGADLGIKNVVRQAIPSIHRTISHYMPRR